MLTHLVDEASTGNDWLDGITYDGYRMQRAHRCAPVSSMVCLPDLAEARIDRGPSLLARQDAARP